MEARAKTWYRSHVKRHAVRVICGRASLNLLVEYSFDHTFPSTDFVYRFLRLTTTELVVVIYIFSGIV